MPPRQAQGTAAACRRLPLSLLLLLLLLLLLALAATAAAASPPPHLRTQHQPEPVPIVIMHGMGDSAAAQGQQHLAGTVSAAAGGAHVLGVQFGRTQVRDQLDSFIVNMNAQVDAFATTVLADPVLAGSPTMDAIGISQGNLVIRGYIQRYAGGNSNSNTTSSYPRVRRWLSIHGPLLGVAGIPDCNRTRWELCSKLDSLLDVAAYARVVQAHIAQADYYRDPLHTQAYLAHNSFLPYLNHELVDAPQPLYPYGLASLDALVLVKAMQDVEVIPSESEWFGYFYVQPDDGSLALLSMREHPLYQSDAFGLRTLDGAGRVHFESTPGGHCEFSLDWAAAMVRTYFATPATAATAVAEA